MSKRKLQARVSGNETLISVEGDPLTYWIMKSNGSYSKRPGTASLLLRECEWAHGLQDLGSGPTVYTYEEAK